MIDEAYRAEPRNRDSDADLGMSEVLDATQKEAIRMLGESPLYANVPVKDLQEARGFYEEVLGITPARESETEIVYRAGNSRFAIYPTQDAGSAQHTLASFIVEDIEAMVTGLRSRGVTFEEYDMPAVEPVNGIAHLGPDKVAWFKDPDGNILALVQEDV